MTDSFNTLFEVIRDAFVREKKPIGDCLFMQSPFSDGRTLDILETVTQQDVSLDDLVQCRDVASLTPAGFEYFLPAYMRLLASDPDSADTLRDDVLGRLLSPASSTYSNIYEHLQCTLNAEQRTAVRRFLEFMYDINSRWIPRNLPPRETALSAWKS